MAPQDYRNFDLVIEPDGEDFDVHVVDSPAGEAHGSFRLPFGHHELENFILKMGARRGVRRAGPAPRTAAQDFGQRLYGALFDGEVEFALRQSLQECQANGDGLRIRLRLHQAPALVDLPWEYLHSPSLGRPLALSTDTPLVRYMDMGVPVTALTVAPPLRVLVVASSPDDIESLDTDRELGNLRDATADLVRQGRIEVHALATPTVASLQHQLRKDAFHILHFMGHGIFDEATGTGMLAFEDDQGRARPVAGTDLGMMLHDHRSLQMVVLNACEGARTSIKDPLGGVAQSLARQGIPAVVAMQFEISDIAAKHFSHELYLAIADGYPVDAAVSEARKALYLQDRATEWGTPVLHLRAADGRIFDMVDVATEASVPDLLEQVEVQAGAADPTMEISAIGILQRILALDPDNREAANQLTRLQAAARLPAAGDDPIGASVDPPAPAAEGGSTSVSSEATLPPDVTSPPAPPASQSPVPERSSPARTQPTESEPHGSLSPTTGSESQGLVAPPVGGGDGPDRRGSGGRAAKVAGWAAVAAAVLIGVVTNLGPEVDDDPTIDATVLFTPTEAPSPGDPVAWVGELSSSTWAAFQAPSRPTVDGDLADWGEVVGGVAVESVVSGGDDGIAASGVVSWDADALYLAVRVRDDIVAQDWHGQPSQLWRGDSVSFEFAPRPSDDAAATVVPGDVHVLLGPDDGTGDGALAAINPARGGGFGAGGVEGSIEVASSLHDGGYDLEAAVPWSLLGIDPARGRVVGFNLNASNVDASGEFSSMVSSTPGRVAGNQPRPACWGRLLLWDDPTVQPDDDQLPDAAAAAAC